ncbi:MAG: Uma2 family endonuclease [Chloroherpetonaceae bacterium]|nr:Uma2 family endonuclease [Chloroherpetonaceae bacterium]
MMTIAPVETQAELDEQSYPIEEKLGQGKKHEKRLRELVSMLEVIFENQRDVIVGGDRFIYYEKGNRRKVVAPDAFVIRGYEGEEPDAFKVWEKPIDLRFACEIWSAQNSEAERMRKFGVYQDILRAREYAELTQDERLYGYRLNEEGEYEQVKPNEQGRLAMRELGAELAFEGGLIRVYRDGKKIPTLSEALKQRDA